MRRATARVLLVNNIVDEREMYAAWLRHEGYCTLQATNVRDGYRLAAELAPAIVVTADRFGNADDGIEFARWLKRDLRPTPVVMLSSRVIPDNGTAAVVAGCDLVLAKPCLPQQLSRAIDHLLGRAPAPYAALSAVP